MSKKVKVTKVVDGDTFWGADANGKLEKYRMLNFNTPEIDDPGYEIGKKALTDLIGEKNIMVEVDGEGYYGRALVYVTTLDGIDVNAEMKKVAEEIAAKEWKNDLY